jgi:hypothetical protein
MTSGEYYENKWLYMKYIGKCVTVKILLTRLFSSIYDLNTNSRRHNVFDYIEIFGEKIKSCLKKKRNII